MYSTWVDNDHHNEQTNRRIESASKRSACNRIQVVSKMNPSFERSPMPPNQPLYHNHSPIESFNQTCVDRTNKLPLKRLNTVDACPEKDERDGNLLKLMQQQLQLAKFAYEEKIKLQLKQSSIELSKLKIKIQQNAELIASKDQMIEQLRDELRRESPTKKQTDISKPIVQVQSVPLMITQKINDIEVKFSIVADTQTKLSQKMGDISSRVELVEKGLLSILACKMANLQARINQISDIANTKIDKIQGQFANTIKGKKDMPPGPSNKFVQPVQPFSSTAMQSIIQKLQILKQQCYAFKNKEFRYENSNILSIRRDMGVLQTTVHELEKKLAHSRLKNSKASSRKPYDYDRRVNQAGNSCLFQDYQEVYQQVDSVGEDQFFHPIEQSAKRYHSKQNINVTHFRSSTKPTLTHNDSFQKFTDQQEQQRSNIKRLENFLLGRKLHLPLPIQIDLGGCLRNKLDQRLLTDRDKKTFTLNKQQLNICKKKGWITW